MSEVILEEGVLIGNPVKGWERIVKKMQVNLITGNVIIQKGHGLTDISCRHGSRWIWWKKGLTKESKSQGNRGFWYQVVYAPGCDCGAPPEPYKIQVSRIRKSYFDAIVSGEKGEELKALSPYWIRRLIETETPPNVIKFICGKRVHSRKITKIFKDKPQTILGRPISEQGRIDLQLDMYDGHCIVVELGKEVVA